MLEGRRNFVARQTEVTLKLHPDDLEQLRAAAVTIGYSIEEYARLALHKASQATLDASKGSLLLSSIRG